MSFSAIFVYFVATLHFNVFHKLRENPQASDKSYFAAFTWKYFQ